MKYSKLILITCTIALYTCGAMSRSGTTTTDVWDEIGSNMGKMYNCDDNYFDSGNGDRTDAGCYTFEEKAISNRSGLMDESVGGLPTGYSPCDNGYVGEWTMHSPSYNFAAFCGITNGETSCELSNYINLYNAQMADDPLIMRQYACTSCGEFYYDETEYNTTVKPLRKSTNNLYYDWDFWRANRYGNPNDMIVFGFSAAGYPTNNSATYENLFIPDSQHASSTVKDLMDNNKLVSCYCDSDTCKGITNTETYTGYRTISYRTCWANSETLFSGCVIQQTTACNNGYYWNNTNKECNKCQPFHNVPASSTKRTKIVGGTEIDTYGANGISDCYIPTGTSITDDKGTYTTGSDCTYYQ